MVTEFKVNDQSPAVAGMAGNWPMIDALMGGTAAMRKAGKSLLPKFPAESEDAYGARLATATLFPAFTRTASIMAAKPFARPIQIDEASVPEQVRALMSDVDLMGTPLQPFAACLMQKVMEYGLVGVLVDAPPAAGIRTVAEEKAAKVRPYFTVYPCATILGWKVDRAGKEAALTQLRLLEDFSEPNGPWGETTKQQVRVLTPGAWEIWRQRTEGASQTWELFEQGTTSIDVIPFAFFYGERDGFGVASPPLLDLAFLNVEHWQSSSDQQTILHVARVPILFAKGFAAGDQITIGAASATTTENAEADLSYVEHTGAAIEAGRQSIQDLEDRMRQSGAELLVQQPAGANTTATQVMSDDEGNRSTLQKIAEGFDESLAAILNLMGKWLRLDMQAKLQLYKDFGSSNLPERNGQLLLSAASAGHVSSQTAYEQLQRMDVVDQDLDWDDEQLRLDQDHKRKVAQTAEVAKANAAASAGPDT